MEPRDAVGRHQGKGGSHGWKVRQTSLGDEEMVVFICLKKGLCLRLERAPPGQGLWTLGDVTWPANPGGRTPVLSGCSERQERWEALCPGRCGKVRTLRSCDQSFDGSPCADA